MAPRYEDDRNEMPARRPGKKSEKPRREAVPEASRPALPGEQAEETAGHHVLIVDDSESIRRSVRETLSTMPGIRTIEEAGDGVEGLSIISRKYCDLVITDVNMPRLDGFKLVSALRRQPQFRDVMIIVLSSLGDSVDKIKGLTVGANDYVTKPFEKGELQARVTVMFKMRELQKELQRKNEAMEQANMKLAMLANQDGLTGIPNRRYFFERYEVEFQRARRLDSPLGLLMIDIDHFKSFNDTWGHQAGDEALRTVARAVQDGIRTYDMVGRYGGEEMIAFLPETDCDNALLVAERLRRDVASRVLDPIGGDSGKRVSLTVSIGIACRPDVDARESGDLVRAADSALYLAKAGGRNICVVADREEPDQPPGS